MNELINSNAIKMTSIEIAELVGSRHDKVKQSIERLAGRGVIAFPPMGEKPTAGRPVSYYIFEGEQGKRDSIIVVAQLSPEFTARLVDRWRELEEAAVNIPKTLPEALRLAADLAEQKMQLENQLAIAAPKVEFADRVGEASGILIGNYAKVVGIGPNKLFAWMRDHKILIASGSRRNVPMQEYMERGYFTVKETAVNTNHGIQISFTTKITGRGQQWLTRKLLDNGMLKVQGGCLMANLRKEARGRECQVRIYGICNGNPETTVLAHYRMAGICGTGMKPEDLIGAWACSACHDEIDRRTHNLDNKDARLYHLEGVIRTQAILLKEGKIKS